MLKQIAKIIKAFLPKKLWLRKIYAALTRDRLAEIEAKIDTVSRQIQDFQKYRHYISVVNIMRGEDFKTYFITHNMPDVIWTLKENMDIQSKKVIDQKLTHFLHFPLNGVYAHHFMADTREILYTDQDRKENAEFLQNLEYLRERYKGNYDAKYWPSGFRAPESFYYHHGLKFLNERAIKWLEGKSALDIGALNGDSAIALSEYGFSKIHMFELIRSAEKVIAANILANGFDPTKYVFHNMGLSDKVGEVTIPEDAILDISYSIHTVNNTVECYKVPITTIDEFFSETSEKIGMIKIDAEGEDFPIIRGGVQTIRKHRPVISIAIYHSPDQFFELKPYLEKHIEQYRFMIRNLNFCHLNELETTLICIPQELANYDIG